MNTDVEFKDLYALREYQPAGLALPWMQLPMLDHLLSAHGVPRTGVIHLGAHAGQEILLYTWLGFPRAVMVEPQPGEFDTLVEKCASMTTFQRVVHDFLGEGSRAPIEFQCVRCAVAEAPGTATFHKTANSHLSSLASPASELSAEERFEAEEIEVEVRTLDDLAASLEHGWEADDFSYLRMNIQGGELKALMGGDELLKSLKAVFLEVGMEHRYEGQPVKEDFDRFLEPRGFECVFAVRSKDVGNLFYVRR